MAAFQEASHASRNVPVGVGGSEIVIDVFRSVGQQFELICAICLASVLDLLQTPDGFGVKMQ